MSEQMNDTPFTIGLLDTVPEPDPFNNNSATRTVLKIDPSAKRVYATQETNSNGTRMDEYYSLILTVSVGGHPKQDDLRSYINTELCDLIDRVIAGHSAEWDGRNISGILTDDGGQALSHIRIHMEGYGCGEAGEVPSYYELWDLDDYLEQVDITSTTTDKEIHELATIEEHIVLSGDPVHHLKNIRRQCQQEDLDN